MSDTSHAQATSTTNNDNLGISWEIGVIIGIVVIVLSVIAAAIFQRRRRRLALNLAQDLEKTQRRRSPTDISSMRPYSSSSTTLKETKESTNMAVEVPDFKSTTIPKVFFLQRPPRYQAPRDPHEPNTFLNVRHKNRPITTGIIDRSLSSVLTASKSTLYFYTITLYIYSVFHCSILVS
ncbi:hypothetical protein F5051DRAFT_409109 [Lentinula edodes]|nr:hypothetical protein F5051DRAFT_409109 [Lentinula edodes]